MIPESADGRHRLPDPPSEGVETSPQDGEAPTAALDGPTSPWGELDGRRAIHELTDQDEFSVAISPGRHILKMAFRSGNDVSLEETTLEPDKPCVQSGACRSLGH